MRGRKPPAHAGGYLQFIQFIGTLGLVCGVTAVFTSLIPENALTAGFAYLITILLIAVSWGLTQSVVASIMATLFLNYYFLPPKGTLTIADPQNWAALLAFLVTSLVASQLSDRAVRRADEATNRQMDMERLYALSRSVMLRDLQQPAGLQIAREIARIYEFPAVAIYDRSEGTVYSAGPEDIPGVEPTLRDASMTGAISRDESGQLLIAGVRLGGHAVGAFAARCLIVSDAALHALLNLIAISLENARDRQMATRADAARQSEEFKSTLLDGLAHEFKTPLTSIKAATSGLLTGSVPQPAQQHELLTVIDQETNRLNSLVNEAIHLARIEAGKLQLQRQPTRVQDLVEPVLKQLEFLWEGRDIITSFDERLPLVSADADLLQLAIKQLVDNAIKYSPQRSPIRIKAMASDGTVSIGIHNIGDPLVEAELMHVFDKFYRGTNVGGRAAGTGMGLSVAREILRAHGGDIHVESSSSEGTLFTAVLPVASKGEGR
jgi:two-component system sensor histidine kinase KdpD